MMEGDRNLNQALQEPLLWPFALPPNVFPDLVRVKKMALVEEPDSPPISLNIHAQILAARSRQPGPDEPMSSHEYPANPFICSCRQYLVLGVEGEAKCDEPEGNISRAQSDHDEHYVREMNLYERLHEREHDQSGNCRQ